MDPLLEVEDLRIWVATGSGPLMIVDGMTFDVQRGEVHGIAGESGSGKSMTAQALMGLLAENFAFEGNIVLDGHKVGDHADLSFNRVRGTQMSMIFQDPLNSLHPQLTVGKQLTEYAGRRGPAVRKADQHARELLREVRIPDPDWAMKAYPHQFSGGMRQRIAIAMALVEDPKVLIADEPTTALDVTVQAGVLSLLRRLCDERGLGVILITHDLGVMHAMADQLTIMYAGRGVAQGPAQELLSSPAHPYTDQLVKALPRGPVAGGQQRSMVAIKGEPATPRNRPTGCAFHPRCPYAELECSRSIPALAPIGERRRLACPVDPLR